MTKWSLSMIPLTVLCYIHFKPILRIHGRSMQPTLNPNDQLSQDVVLIDPLTMKRMELHDGIQSDGDSMHELRGKLIVLYSPLHPFTLLIKRVLAVPGDLIQPNPHARPRPVHKRGIFQIYSNEHTHESNQLYHERRQAYHQLCDAGRIPEYTRYREFKRGYDIPQSHSSDVDMSLEQYEEQGFMMVPPGYCWVESDEPFHGIDSNTFGFVPLALIHGTATRIVWPPARIRPLHPILPSSDRLITRESRRTSKHTAQEEKDESLYRHWMHLISHMGIIT